MLFTKTVKYWMYKQNIKSINIFVFSHKKWDKSYIFCRCEQNAADIVKGAYVQQLEYNAYVKFLT